MLVNGAPGLLWGWSIRHWWIAFPQGKTLVANLSICYDVSSLNFTKSQTYEIRCLNAQIFFQFSRWLSSSAVERFVIFQSVWKKTKIQSSNIDKSYAKMFMLYWNGPYTPHSSSYMPGGHKTVLRIARQLSGLYHCHQLTIKIIKALDITVITTRVLGQP